MRTVKRGEFIRCAHGTCGEKHKLDADEAAVMNAGKYIEIECTNCNTKYWAELKHGSYKTGVFAI